MEVRQKKLPIGIEDFEELQTENFYYVDKTNLIKELLNHWAKVNLFTRPRRFGKSLNMSILLGILGFQDIWSVSSNKESGDGDSDILVETDDGEVGIVLEVKYAEEGGLETACREALEQIERKWYEEELLDEGIHHILKYGIAFYKKRCRVMLAGFEDSLQ